MQRITDTFKKRSSELVQNAENTTDKVINQGFDYAERKLKIMPEMIGRGHGKKNKKGKKSKKNKKIIKSKLFEQESKLEQRSDNVVDDEPEQENELENGLDDSGPSVVSDNESTNDEPNDGELNGGESNNDESKDDKLNSDGDEPLVEMSSDAEESESGIDLSSPLLEPTKKGSGMTNAVLGAAALGGSVFVQSDNESYSSILQAVIVVSLLASAVLLYSLSKKLTTTNRQLGLVCLVASVLSLYGAWRSNEAINIVNSLLGKKSTPVAS